MYRFLQIILISLLLVLPARVLQAAEMGIAVVVNEDAVSLEDLNDRMRLIIASSRLPNTEDTRRKLAPQIVSNLIEEQLQLQEAARLEIEVKQPEIDSGFAAIAQQNNFTPEQFKDVLKKSSVNVGTMERQIQAQIAWSNVVQKTLRPKVIISDADVDATLDRLKASEGKTELLVSEIFLPVENVAEEKEIKGLARELVGQVRSKKASFFKLAQQFSKAPGAPQGGDLGWVQQGQMDPDLDSVIAALDRDAISDPVRSLAGFHIFFLRDKRVISEETLPTREQVFQGLGQQRLDRLQRRHLQELRASAFIENRLGS